MVGRHYLTEQERETLRVLAGMVATSYHERGEPDVRYELPEVGDDRHGFFLDGLYRDETRFVAMSRQNGVITVYTEVDDRRSPTSPKNHERRLQYATMSDYIRLIQEDVA